jgi:superfamily II DNA/RNA helicase
VRTYLTDPGRARRRDSTSPVTTMDHRVWAVQSDAKTAVAAEVRGPARAHPVLRAAPSTAPTAWPCSCGARAWPPAPSTATSPRARAAAPRRLLDRPRARAGRHRRRRRGIHVDDVDLVVHFDPPADHKDYLHRSGRTARAGASGTVLSLVLSDQVREHQRLRERAGVEASALTVVPGHPAVRELAASGEAIDLSTVPPRPPASSRPDSAARHRRPPRRPDRADVRQRPRRRRAA